MAHDLPVICAAHRFGFSLAAMWFESITKATLMWAVFWSFIFGKLDFGQPDLNAHEYLQHPSLPAFS
jgi:hypothetical protein